MTEERKQELRQLLAEAMVVGNLEIRRSKRGVSLPSIDVSEYKELLLRRWVSHSENSRLVWENFELDVISKTTKSRLLDFIREEYAPFINEDRIQSSCSFISGSPGDGYPLNDFLEQLMNIAIGKGIARAVSDFDRYTKETQVSVRYMALLEGIKIEKEIQVFKGIQLLPLPNSSSNLPNYLPASMISVTNRSANFFCNKMLLITDHLISPVFHSPLQETTIRKHLFYNFRVNVNDGFENICQVLSLACNSAVQISVKWPFWPEDELFYLSPPGPGPPQLSVPPGLFANRAEVGETEINEAKCLYKILDRNSDIREKLRIPIDRWVMSKTNRSPVDKMIDLGIALEALYVTRANRKGKQLCHRASWYLGENPAHQQELETELEAIYDYRSDIVHNRELKEEVPVGEQSVSFLELVTRSQDLCRRSILEIIKDGQFPDWNTLRQSAKAKWANS